MDIREKIEWLENELKALKGELKEIDRGDTYYCISDVYSVNQNNWNGDIVDSILKYAGNVYPADKYSLEYVQKIANAKREKDRIESIMRKYSEPFLVSTDYDKPTENYSIVFDHEDNRFMVVNGSMTLQHDGYNFRTLEIGYKVIEECGEDKLKKYWFSTEKEYLESEEN